MNAFQVECAAQALQHHFGTATIHPDEAGYEVGYLVEQGYNHDVAVAGVQAWWDRPALLQRQAATLDSFWDAVDGVSGRWAPTNDQRGGP